MNRVVLILLISTGSLATTSVWLHHQLHLERTRAAVLETRLAQAASHSDADLEVRDPALSRAAITAPAISSATTSVPATDTLAANAAESQDQIQARFRQQIVRQQQALMNDPEYREAMRLQQRANLMQTLPGLATELGISQQQADRLLDLLADQQTRTSQDLELFAGDDSSDPSTLEQRRRAFEERERNNEGELRELLGSDGMQRWQEYQNGAPIRWRLQQLSASLDAAGTPLRQDQRLAVRDALAAGYRRMDEQMQQTQTMNTGASYTQEQLLKFQEAQLETMTAEQQRIRESLAGVLSAEQLTSYDRLTNSELALQRAQLRVQRTQLESGLTDNSAQEFVVSGSMPGTAPAAGLIVDEAPSSH